METIHFDTTDGLRLEGELRAPDGPPRGTAVLCHPLPTHGGSKDHPLLWAIRNELAGTHGLVVLSFNFRGVMGSEGEFGAGEAEVADAQAAIGRVREEADGPTIVAGWSFGAVVALRQAVRDDRVGGLALIGMPLGTDSERVPSLPDRGELGALAIPVLLIAGAADQFCPTPELRSFARRIPEARAEIVADTGHFFERREREVAGLIGDLAETVLTR